VRADDCGQCVVVVAVVVVVVVVVGWYTHRQRESEL
jgi:hypothetical protein